MTKKRDSHPQSDLMLHTGMLKGFMDGSLGSHTAAMLEPYSDAIPTIQACRATKPPSSTS